LLPSSQSSHSLAHNVAGFATSMIELDNAANAKGCCLGLMVRPLFGRTITWSRAGAALSTVDQLFDIGAGLRLSTVGLYKEDMI
jgi:hypothetical protein